MEYFNFTEEIYNKTSGLACEWLKQLNMTSVPYKTSLAIIPRTTLAICVHLTLKGSYMKVFIINHGKLKMIICIMKNHHTGSPGLGGKMDD